MKRVVCILLMMGMLQCAVSRAEGGSGISEIGHITQIMPEAELDLDGDGDLEKTDFEIIQDEEGYDTGYRLTVGDEAIEGTGWYLNDKIYTLRLNEEDTLLMVSDFGPSDDY